MSSLKSFAVTVCVCCIACSIIGIIAPSGRMKKILNLVLGAFLAVSMIIPFIGLSDSFSKDMYFETSEFLSADIDEKEYEKLVLNKTADNLVLAANDLLLSEDIKVDNIEIGIKKSDTNSIYISKINIYISDKEKDKAEKIKSIITRNMSKEPVIIISE